MRFDDHEFLVCMVGNLLYLSQRFDSGLDSVYSVEEILVDMYVDVPERMT